MVDRSSLDVIVSSSSSHIGTNRATINTDTRTIDHHQLTLILDVLGTPTLEEYNAISSRRSRDYLRALPFRKKRNFATIYPNASALAVDFLNRSLTFDPKKRITVEEALAHPYLSNYREWGFDDRVAVRTVLII